MSQRYLWRVYCPSSQQYETILSETEPLVCPSDGITQLDPSFTTIIQSEFEEMVSSGYINIDSELADNQAIKILASNVNGGILISSGLGGILINTSNSISLNAQAASNFTTSVGNLSLNATTGLINIDSGTGINIGNNSSTIITNIGTN